MTDTFKKTLNGFAAASLSIAACLFPTPSFSGHFINKTQIDRVIVHDWGQGVFIFTSTPANNEPCSTPNSALLLLRSNPQFKEIYAAVLTAALTRTPVGGYTSDCDPGHYNMPILRRLDVITGPDAVYP